MQQFRIYERQQLGEVKVVESSTGEVVASMTTEGKATGDTSRSIAGIGGTWGGVVGGALSSSATGERGDLVP